MVQACKLPVRKSHSTDKVPVYMRTRETKPSQLISTELTKNDILPDYINKLYDHLLQC